MKCECECEFDKCFWPGQCDADIARLKAAQERYNRLMSPEVITNQQATANHTISWWKARQILIDGNEKLKERKMTRNEAIEKVSSLYGRTSAATVLIESLETLGLIKFDEEITELDILKHYHSVPQAIVNHLDRMGYKIVKK